MVKLRNGEIIGPKKSDAFRWGHLNWADDIIAYRIVKPSAVESVLGQIDYEFSDRFGVHRFCFLNIVRRGSGSGGSSILSNIDWRHCHL